MATGTEKSVLLLTLLFGKATGPGHPVVHGAEQPTWYTGP